MREEVRNIPINRSLQNSEGGFSHLIPAILIFHKEFHAVSKYLSNRSPVFDSNNYFIKPVVKYAQLGWQPRIGGTSAEVTPFLVNTENADTLMKNCRFDDLGKAGEFDPNWTLPAAFAAPKEVFIWILTEVGYLNSAQLRAFAAEASVV